MVKIINFPFYFLTSLSNYVEGGNFPLHQGLIMAIYKFQLSKSPQPTPISSRSIKLYLIESKSHASSTSKGKGKNYEPNMCLVSKIENNISFFYVDLLKVTPDKRKTQILPNMLNPRKKKSFEMKKPNPKISFDIIEDRTRWGWW